jgi:glycosyltransferase involved in cell wall biosynthesis
LRVLIDAHMVGERETGNETYIANLIRGLQSLETPDQFLIATAHRDTLNRQLELGSRFRVVDVSQSPIKRLLADLPRIARQERVDLIHVTYTAPVWVSAPFVVTVHDIAYRHHREWFSFRDRLVLEIGVGLTLKRATKVITVSEHARQDICNCYNIPADKVAVTHEAADTRLYRVIDNRHRVQEALARYGIAERYILSVGNLQPRKNLHRLVKAYAILREKAKIQHKLVIVGKAQWRTSELYSLIHERQLDQDIVFTGYVPDKDLPLLYNGADVFAYPSLFEGFGLPVLEAMACGTPVVTSAVASIPEVATDAAILVNPCQVDEIAEAIQAVLSMPRLAEELKQRGLQRVARFSWRETAEETLEAYKNSIEAMQLR